VEEVMKLIIFLFAFLFFSLSLFSQTLESIIADKDYLSVLMSLSEDSNTYEKLDNATTEQVMRLAKIAYEAHENDPVGVYRFLVSKNKEWGELVRNDKSKINKPRIGNIRGQIWELIKQKISVKTYEVCRIPFFVKANIISKDTVIYTDFSTGFDYTKVNIIVEVIEVLKGKNTFKEGDKLEFYYLRSWEKPKNEFEIGDTYFLPLEPRSEDDIDYDMIALVTYIDTPDVVFEIRNGVLLDKENYFGYGNNIDWEIFEKKFNAFVTKIKEGN
jgi:hypothetical protein